MDEKEKWREQLRRDVAWAHMACHGENIVMFMVYHLPQGAPVAYHFNRTQQNWSKTQSYVLARALAAAHEAKAVSLVSEAWMSKMKRPIGDTPEAVREMLAETDFRPSRDPDRVETLASFIQYHDAQGHMQHLTDIYPIQRDEKGRIVGFGDEFITSESNRLGIERDEGFFEVTPILVGNRAQLYAKGMVKAGRETMAAIQPLIAQLRVKPAVML